MIPFWQDICTAVFGAERPDFERVGVGDLPSRYAVTDFACATVAAAGQALADLMDGGAVRVDRRLASLWFQGAVAPLGWEMADPWDAVAGNYAAQDGWIRLHTNAPHHRAAALSVLGCDGTRAAVAVVVQGWAADALETAVVGAGGAAARLRSRADWAAHPQGRAVAAEPLVAWQDHGAVPPRTLAGGATPLSGLRVLDLTRVLAGPVATRLLAGFGAQVLRIDPPGWDEPGVLPDVTLGKRCVALDLRQAADRASFQRLLEGADVLVHGYRPGALDGLGFGAAARRALNPALIDVSLDAYGHTGPWAERRGFDSLVQMSDGIAAPMTPGGKPHPLPVQALDHGTGHLMAAAVLRGLALRAGGRAVSARLSLARTGEALALHPGDADTGTLTPDDADWQEAPEPTGWGPARRLRPPLRVGGIAPVWSIPAGLLRRDPPRWPG